MNKKEKEIVKETVSLIQKVSQEVNTERAEKLGYDILCGLYTGDAKDRLKAWSDWMNQEDRSEGVRSERNGAWVPAIPL